MKLISVILLFITGVAFAQPVKTPLPISQGGTGAYLRPDALYNLLPDSTGASTKFLRGDQTWQAIAASVVVPAVIQIDSGGTGQVTANAAFNALAPSQTSQSGKYLTTDGTNTSWGTVAGSSYTFTNGLTNTSGTVSLGGTLSGATTVAQSTNALAFTGTGPIGIGVASPAANSRLEVDGTVFFNGTTGVIPTTGNGTRFMYIPSLGAIRAGTISGNSTAWNTTTQVAANSTAFGTNTKASGVQSTALGSGTIASAAQSMAMGINTNASGTNSFTGGVGATTEGNGSFSYGFNADASNPYSIAMGSNVTASGNNSIALGSYVTTNAQNGAIIIGDSSGTTTLNAPAVNSFTVRAAGGTIIYSNAATTTGVVMTAGGSSWAAVSDSNRKENRLAANDEKILNSIEHLWLGSWNYKGQDAKAFRHYGPMAQDFFAAFGHDRYGVIGNDTLIASHEFTAVTMIGVQALARRTDKEADEIAGLIAYVHALNARIAILEKKRKHGRV